MAGPKVPTMLKHCVVATYRDGGLKGTAREKAISAWKICRARLTEYGFLASGSEDGPVEKIRLTAKGLKRESYHARDTGAQQKNALFEEFYAAYLRLDETTDGKEQIQGDARLERQEGQEDRRMRQASKSPKVQGREKKQTIKGPARTPTKTTKPSKPRR